MAAQPKPAYELRDHTADILLRVYGRDTRELFTNAAAGLYAVLGEIVAAGEDAAVTITLTAENREELLHDWLSEALYYAEARHAFFREFRFTELTDKGLIANVSVARMDLERCAFDREIKAVTYHELAIAREGDGLVATVVLDI